MSPFSSISRASAERPFYSCIFDRTTSRFCSWATSKDDTLIYGGVFEPKGLPRSLRDAEKRLPKADFDLRTPIYTEACAVLRPEGMRQFRLGYDNAFLVGRSGGLHQPHLLRGHKLGDHRRFAAGRSTDRARRTH